MSLDKDRIFDLALPISHKSFHQLLLKQFGIRDEEIGTNKSLLVCVFMNGFKRKIDWVPPE